MQNHSSGLVPYHFIRQAQTRLSPRLVKTRPYLSFKTNRELSCHISSWVVPWLSLVSFPYSRKWRPLLLSFISSNCHGHVSPFNSFVFLFLLNFYHRLTLLFICSCSVSSAKTCLYLFLDLLLTSRIVFGIQCVFDRYFE